MDVGTQYLGQAEFVDYRVETFSRRIPAVGLAVNNEEMDVIGTPQAMEKLYFLAYIYKMKGDLQAENEALVSLLKAKDHRSNDISTLTINDIDQDIELELERLHKQKTEQYTRIILVGIVALTLLFLAWFRWRRK